MRSDILDMTPPDASSDCCCGLGTGAGSSDAADDSFALAESKLSHIGLYTDLYTMDGLVVWYW